ncbi:hypothetical protein [Sphingomonas ginkgonis]|nr:hypothetical protein [Sphingomonas ginkgonis]
MKHEKIEVVPDLVSASYVRGLGACMLASLVIWAALLLTIR